MTWLRQTASRLGALFRKGRLEQELDEELRSHVERLVEENLRQGMSTEEARHAALRSFGGVEQVKEDYRERRGLPMIETTLQDLHYGVRQLRRNPGFTAVVVLTLALGIGANTAIFSVVNAVFLRPLPYPQSSRLLWIAEANPALKAEIAGGGDYVDWKDYNQTLEQITAYDESGSFNLTGHGTPARLHAAQVSASFFATLGVDPQLGRRFTPQEDRPNGPNAIILMHSFWQQYSGSDPQVLGRTITLDATPYTVVGVMPASFRFPGGSDIQMLLPLALNEASERLRVQQQLVKIIGRLKPGVSMARAFADLDAIRKRAQPPVFGGPTPAGAPGGPNDFGPGPGPGPTPGGQRSIVRIETSGPATLPSGGGLPNGPGPAQPTGESGARPDQPFGTAAAAVKGAETRAGQSAHSSPQPVPMGVKPSPGGGPHIALRRPKQLPENELKVVGLAEHLAGNLRPAMLTLLGVVGLVLLIACANVANLVLTRASTRTREVAVRAVLGAGRWRLVRQLLSESVILGLAGGVAGVLLAAWGAGLMTRLIPASASGGILSMVRVRVDTHVLLFALAVSAATSLLFGLVPALSATQVDLSLAERLKEGAQVASAGPRRGLLRGALAVAELSLALVLLIGAGLLIKSFYRLLSVDPGFAPERLLTMNISLTDSRYPEPTQMRGFFSDVLRRIGSLPGVRSAALSDSLPLSPYRARLMIRREIATPGATGPSSSGVLMSRLSVSTGYFYTLGIPVLKGRTFTDGDNEQAAKVAVVNETLARHLWPSGDPVGQRLPLLREELTVIGVVGNTRHEGLGQDPDSEIYVPYLQQPEGSMQLAVRTAQDPAGLASAVRGEIAAIDSEQPIYNVTTLEQTISESVAPRRFNMLLLGVFAAVALALATVGIYGVMAFSVTQRIHEIGIRMALGAERGDVLGLVGWQGLGLTLIGVALGVAGAWVLTRFLTGFLYGVRPTDPATFVLVSLALATASMLASYIPARRATKVDPMVALRYE